MKFVKPNSRDIADIGLAIKSFTGAWGCIDFFGDYQPQANGVTLWLMFNYSVSDIKILYEEVAPAEYSKRFLEMLPTEIEADSGSLHAQATKVKTGLFSNGWVIKVTYLVDKYEFPVGFIGSTQQTMAWGKLHEALLLKERLVYNAQTAVL